MKRKTAALAAALVAVLLSGCAPREAGTPAPSPSPAQAADTPSPAEDTASPEVSVSAALTPTPSPSPTPEPTEEVKELWGFPIDHTHDAFEVPTGGRLGTVLVTVEMETEGEDENAEYTSTFSVWVASDLTEPIQTMVQEGVTTHTHKLLDANFDGRMDFCYTQYKGAKNENYCLYIWDEEQGKFSFVESFLGSPGTNVKNKTFENWSNGGGGAAIDEIFRWENDKLVCVREVMLGYPDENGQELVVCDLTGGKLAEVFRETFPVSAYTASELWLDVNYHGEGMELLARQPIDDTHDFFTVPTGGRLGTVVVTVEVGPAKYDGTLNKFSVWSKDDLTTPIQTMEAEAYQVLHWSDIVDANFDGYMDFGYMYAMGNQPCYWHYWIWNEEQGQFVAEPEFDQISCPQFNPETGIIDGWARYSAAGDGLATFHRWEDGKLVCVRRITANALMEEAATLLVEDREDGELKEVFYREYPWEEIAGEIEGMETWWQDRMKWEDLSYHGET